MKRAAGHAVCTAGTDVGVEMEMIDGTAHTQVEMSAVSPLCGSSASLPVAGAAGGDSLFVIRFMDPVAVPSRLRRSTLADVLLKLAVSHSPLIIALTAFVLRPVVGLPTTGGNIR